MKTSFNETRTTAGSVCKFAGQIWIVAYSCVSEFISRLFVVAVTFCKIWCVYVVMSSRIQDNLQRLVKFAEIQQGISGSLNLKARTLTCALELRLVITQFAAC
ncbi:hypothetical protein Nepgr_030800 [Nepenthes gracilis]|uniref:Uncharacterized protein n=1 Tax=Nepenthes gracilis TaxID=150966 RepID=A0AAD3TGF5_NEPGR|nr:hypothetical protein Nepgr_030800 [Nepenthes gracilis]